MGGIEQLSADTDFRDHVFAYDPSPTERSERQKMVLKAACCCDQVD